VRTAFFAPILALLVPAWQSLADIIPTAGVQSSIAAVNVLNTTGDMLDGSYSLSAPDPLASWSPTDQDLLRRIENSNGFAQARVQSSFASTITFDQVSLETRAGSEAITSSPMGWGAQMSYSRTFHLSFQLDVPTEVTLSAQIARNNGGWGAEGRPISLSFGRDGDAPIFSLIYENDFQMPDQHFAETVMVLAPGTYTVLADSDNQWGAGRGGQFGDQMLFDLRVVPSPASAIAFMGGCLMTAGKRRR